MASSDQDLPPESWMSSCARWRVI